ncbi:LuxR C-terminal-related transcriptional regulator [Streptomyces sp. NPDC023998]|uniref:helix-turn-helix transcriptional regulator n=1 Tax=Streptomyces sp. NPDC023998 TaxID=3154597 RepID=UPI00340B49F6
MNMNALPRQWPLVGRAPQLAAFDQVVADPEYTGFLIHGAAGVGKSRLAQECLARATQAGRPTGRAMATAAAAKMPLGAIAHLLPDGVDLSEPVSGFAKVRRLMAGTSGQHSPVVLMIDDLQLLDTTSTILLRQLMDARVIFLLATVRTGESHSDAVAALGRGDAVHQVELDQFEWQEVDTLLQRVLEGPVNRKSSYQMYAASGGNPLFLRELVQGALAAGTLASDGEIWELAATDKLNVTQELTDLIRHRLAAATATGRQVLDTLALCEPLSVAHLESDTGADILHELERSGLVTAFQDKRRTSLRLAHPLHGEVLRADMTAVRRRQILLHQASVLEKTGARRREDAMQLASYHLAATGTAERVLLAQAAALALYSRDHSRALEFLRAIPEEGRTLGELLLLGKALHAEGKTGQAKAVLAAADALAESEPEALAVALLRTQNLIWGEGAPLHVALAANDCARDRVVSPFGLRMLRTNEAAIRVSVGDFAGSLALLDDVESDAAQAPDVQLWLMAATGKAAALAFLGRGAEGAVWAERAVAVCAATSVDKFAMATDDAAVKSVLVLALTESGRLAEARSLAARTFAELGDVPAGPQRMLLAFHLGRNYWLAGRPASARRWYAEVARASRPGTMIGRTLALCGVAASAALLGDAAAAEAALVEHARVDRSVYIPEERLGDAWLHAARGEPELARKVLESAVRDARERGQTAFEVILLTDLARMGRAKDVADRMAELALLCDGPFNAARAEFVAALAADDAERLLDVTYQLETVGANLLAAEAANAAAVLWNKAGHSRCSAAAAARSAANAEQCEGALSPVLIPAVATVPLTRREREIALLASRGLTSKDIAARLSVSNRTVDNHLQRVYAKLGITSRRELVERLNG